MKFFGRERELKLLEEGYAAARGELIPIYGRRRVGKSQLIVQFVREKPTLYFTGLRSTRKQNLDGFARRAVDVTGLRSLGHPVDWETLLRDTVAAWGGEEKKVLVIDEVQWVAESSSEFTSVFQTLWDHEWQHRKDLLIILCGSHFGFFRDHVLRADSPLHGRRTQSIHLQPFEAHDSMGFHPRASREDRARIHFMTGGIPYYLQQFDGESVQQNIVRLFLGPHAFFNNEADYLLHEEIKQVPTAKAILSAIAAGHTRYGEIAEAIGIESSNLQYYLEPLESIGFVEKKVPLSRATQQKTSGRRVQHKQIRYGICDPFLRFWFRFFFFSERPLAVANPERFFRGRIRPHLDAYWGDCWERMCRSQLAWLYDREGLSVQAAVGEYWDKNVQIDVVSLREDDRVDLGECRWSEVRSLSAVARELEQRIAHFPNPAGESIGRHLFVKSYRGSIPDGYSVHALKDLI